MKKYLFAHPWLFAFTVLAGILGQSIGILTPLLTMHIIDAIVTEDLNNLFATIPYMAGFVILFAILIAVMARAVSFFTSKMKFTIRTDLFKALLGTKISDFNQENSAKYISVLNNDIETISRDYFSAITETIKFSSMVVIAIAAMAVIHPVIAVIAAAASSLTLLGPVVFSKQLVKAQTRLSMRNIVANQKVKDYLQGFEVIKTFGVEKNIEPRYEGVAKRQMEASHDVGKASANIGTLTGGIAMLLQFSTYLVGGYFVYLGEITVGGVVAIVGLNAGIISPMNLVSQCVGQIKSAKEINERVISMMELKDTTPRPQKIDNEQTDILINNLSFDYESEQTESTALKNVSYTFKAGKKYALVGHSGSGKTTLTKLIMGYYDNYTGDILINNHNIRNIDRESLYNNMTMMHQSVFILDDTLHNNIVLYNPYSDTEYEEAVKGANLENLIEKLPKGSQTKLGEAGNNLSGGERQRVAIARALIKGSKYIVLDEAMSNLDSETAHNIEKSLLNAKNIGCISVTHRYSKNMLQQYDEILVLRDGELIENGTFDELYAQKGYFYSLYTINGVI
ncbi:MAG: ABC transporter ATP-binding protein/permease [Defluviitaleaceae bacterium]|nr:ABC transporter ATP-binding protein/permease [Defluviitaleaceae bacterium]